MYGSMFSISTTPTITTRDQLITSPALYNRQSFIEQYDKGNYDITDDILTFKVGKTLTTFYLKCVKCKELKTDIGYHWCYPCFKKWDTNAPSNVDFLPDTDDEEEDYCDGGCGKKEIWDSSDKHMCKTCHFKKEEETTPTSPIIEEPTEEVVEVSIPTSSWYYKEDIFKEKAVDIIKEKYNLDCVDFKDYNIDFNNKHLIGTLFWVPEYTRGVSLQGNEGGKIMCITRTTTKSIWWEELKWDKVGEYTWNNTYVYDIIKFTKNGWEKNLISKNWDNIGKKYMERIETFKKRFGVKISEDIKNEIIQYKYKRMSCDLGF
tara:strand:+ start:2160 stop:3113 length:954 start_codon:yes stop_codon:yes gene_type:complete